MNGVRNARFTILVLVAGFVLASIGCSGSEDRKASFLERALRAYEAGDFSKARLDLKNVLRIDPKDALAWYWMGKSEAAEGRVREAYAAYSRAVETDPGQLQARVKRAQLLLTAGDVDRADIDVQAAYAMAPRDPDVLVLSGALKRVKGNVKGSEDEARQALEIKPGHVGASSLLAALLFERQDLAGAEAVLRESIALNPSDVALRLALARIFDVTKNHDDAITVLRDLVAQYPGRNEFRVKLANYYADLQRVGEAQSVLENAVEAAPQEVQRKIDLLQFVAKTLGVPQALAKVADLLEGDPHAMPLRFAQAELHLAANDAAAAESTYRTVIAATSGEGPHAIRAKNALAALLLRTERNDDAAALLEDVLAETPRDPDALQLRATLSMRRKQPEQAVADLRSVLSEYPDLQQAQRLLGEAHALKGDLALAEDAFEKAIRMNPEEPLAYLQLADTRVRAGDADGALATLQELLAKSPDNSAAQIAIAKIQMSGRDWDALSKSAEKISASQPEHPLGFYLKGLMAQRKGEHQEAVRLFEESLALEPDAIEPLVAAARSYLARGTPDVAEQRVKSVLSRYPNSLTALLMLGDIYASSGALEKARSSFEEGVRYHPKSSDAHARLADLLIRKDDISGAMAVLEKGIAETDANGYLVFRLGALYERAGQLDLALKSYEDVVARYPDAAMAINNLVMVLIRDGSDPAALDRARELAKKLAETDVPQYLDTVGWVYYTRKEFERALPYLERAVAAQPDAGELQYHLGMALKQLGRSAEAVEHLSRAVESNTQFPGYAEAESALLQLKPAG